MKTANFQSIQQLNSEKNCKIMKKKLWVLYMQP